MATDSGFTAAEREAMKQRAAELKEAGKPATGQAKRDRERTACLDAIEALEGSDREIGERFHAIVVSEAPMLDPKTWYGFPAYAKQGKVVTFFKPASKFDERYASIGFTGDAPLDDGEFWPESYAVLSITDAFELTLRALVKKAAE